MQSLISKCFILLYSCIFILYYILYIYCLNFINKKLIYENLSVIHGHKSVYTYYDFCIITNFIMNEDVHFQERRVNNKFKTHFYFSVAKINLLTFNTMFLIIKMANSCNKLTFILKKYNSQIF